ncbi:MAG: queuosine precursor transporter [Alphaproteobacteria bacterium]
MADTSSLKPLVLPVIAMALVILLSNIAVQYPVMVVLPMGEAGLNLADWLTWGAFTYPIAFLVTDTTNRVFGFGAARKVVYAGFVIGVALSYYFTDPRIAVASGSAFLFSQILDVVIFDRLRKATWWKAPAISSLIGSAVDTVLFFSIAFAGTGLPWIGWAVGDFAAKLVMIALLLYPFKLITGAVTAPVRG